MSVQRFQLVSTPQVTVRDDVPRHICDTYVARNPLASTYHRIEWLDVIRAAFGQQTKYLAAETSHGIAGVLPLVFFRSRVFGRFAVSVPFFNYGGVLADNADVERALLDRAIEETDQLGGSHLELRHTCQHFAHLAAKRHRVAMTLSLEQTVEAQWNAVDRKLRNQVRKAEKSGLEITDGGAELLESFYQVFARNMRDLGTPVYGSSFFREVVHTFPEHTRVFIVTLSGRPIAASVVHWYGDTIQVPWASSVRELNSLCGNVFLYWHMLRFAVAKHFRVFDFGRSMPGEGAYHFKKQWGAEARPLVWEYWTAPGRALPELNPQNPKFELAIHAWQHVPLRIANAVGPLIVRNIP